MLNHNISRILRIFAKNEKFKENLLKTNKLIKYNWNSKMGILEKLVNVSPIKAAL